MYQVNNWLLLTYAGFRVAGDAPVSFRRARPHERGEEEPMNLTLIEVGNDGQSLATSVTSPGSRAAVRERSVGAVFATSTGEVRLPAGARAMAAMTPTADIQDPARVRSWSPPV